ncbi:histidinol-phosphate aminotransferase [Lutibacter oricola]|uniref:histidinol-phosphate transaminase n=1 Tax=Lutibacter oricola TaxID=762486 RepID=A0A1H2SH91_9FLAO|nr:histidinol-phosphate transaminase [Lutibacter oricola]SDW30878.1 histidinol-phosphate aminotransferase [Lutibacter oricola]
MKTESKTLKSLFKSYLTVKDSYKGGKGVIKKEGQKTYKLSSNENPLGTSSLAINAIKEATKDLHLYPDTTDFRLREALEVYYNRELTKDQFICAASGSEIIDLTIRAFVKEGDEVIVSTPCFVPYKMFSRWSGANVIDVPLLENNYSLNIEGILNVVTEKTRIVFLTSPNNPTGSYISKEIFESLMVQLPTNIVVVFDEVYWHFAEAEDYTTAQSYISRFVNLIAINSFSKTYGLASVRVGYAYMNEEVAAYLRQICKPFLITKLSLEGAIASLKDEVFIQKTVETIHSEKKFLKEEFNKLGIQFYPTQANFYLITPPIPSNEFVQFLAEEGIAVRPVDNFGATGKVRITIGIREANIALIKALNKLKLISLN